MDANDIGRADDAPLPSPGGGRAAAVALRALLDRAFPRQGPYPDARRDAADPALEHALLTGLAGA